MKVFVTVPTTAWVHKMVTLALLKLQLDRRYKLRIMMPTNGPPFENNLHHIINDFMEHGEDYWLCFDNDNPPTRNPLDLIELDKDIIGCPTPVFHSNDKPGERFFYWNAYDRHEDGYREHPPGGGLQRVDAIGTGCFLIARRVFEDPQMRKAPFQRIYNDDGTVELGNDLAFCERATARGFEIWCHYDYPCDHHVEVPMNEMISGIKGLMDG